MHERIQQALGSIGALVLSDYAKGALTSVQTMIRLAREAGVPVLIDPKGTDFERYRGATLLTPNLSEFEAVVGKCQDEAQIVERGMKLIAEFELSALLVTRSEQGMTLLQPGRPPLHMPAVLLLHPGDAGFQRGKVIARAGDVVSAAKIEPFQPRQQVAEFLFHCVQRHGQRIGVLLT